MSIADAPTRDAVWTRVCRVEDLVIERGSAVLLGDTQLALFRTFDERIFATQQQDPYSDAFIMSRGIVGDRQGAPTVASPMYKQVFDLRTGQCLDTQGKDEKNLRTYPVAVQDGEVFIKLGGTPA